MNMVNDSEAESVVVVSNAFNGAPMLSVCVPTYNRATYLDECLAALAPQAAALGVPVYVSDNGSTDNTSEVLANYCNAYAGITAVRQECNLGYDLNHKAVIDMADSRFIWLMGDDDVIMEGALERLLGALNAEPECELMLLNGELTDNQLRPRGRQFDIEHDVVLTDCNELLAKYSNKLTFAAMVIRNKKLDAAERFIGTAHYYAGLAYEYLARQNIENGVNRIRIMSDSFVLFRQGNRPWSEEIGVISVQRIPEFYFNLHEVYGENSRVGLSEAVGNYRVLLPLVRLRASGWLNRNRTRELQKYYFGKYRIRLLSIAFMPMSVAKVLSIFGVVGARSLKLLKRIRWERIGMSSS